jgi:hypothetical protein
MNCRFERDHFRLWVSVSTLYFSSSSASGDYAAMFEYPAESLGFQARNQGEPEHDQPGLAWVDHTSER